MPSNIKLSKQKTKYNLWTKAAKWQIRKKFVSHLHIRESIHFEIFWSKYLHFIIDVLRSWTKKTIHVTSSAHPPGWFIYFAEVVQNNGNLEAHESQNWLREKIAGCHLDKYTALDRCNILCTSYFSCFEQTGGSQELQPTWMLTASESLGTFLLKRLWSLNLAVSSL